MTAETEEELEIIPETDCPWIFAAKVVPCVPADSAGRVLDWLSMASRIWISSCGLTDKSVVGAEALWLGGAGVDERLKVATGV